MASPPIITHIVDKNNYTKHELVALPHVVPTTLAPSSIRFRTRILGQTVNNLTYARMGMFMGWYDIYPLPSDIPAPFNDSKKYGRVPAWGYAEVIESTVPGINPGYTIYGYIPTSTGIETVRVEFASHNGTKIDNQIIVLDEHRQHVWKIYNRYRLCAPLSELEKEPGLKSLGYDALMSALFGTGYCINRYAFAWEEGNRIHPSGEGEWSAQDADLRGATVVVLNASGKTGMSFAYNLRQDRPVEYQPAKVIGVGSPASVSILEKSKLYNMVVQNTEFEETSADVVQWKTTRIVLLDFGARVGALEPWLNSLKATSIPFARITIGSAPAVPDPEAVKKGRPDRSGMNMVHASLLRDKGIAIGGAGYFEEFDRAFEGFKNDVQTLQLAWREGLEGWAEGWDQYCKDEIRANMGMVYKI